MPSRYLESAAAAPTSRLFFDRAGLFESDAATHSRVFTLFAWEPPVEKFENEWSSSGQFFWNASNLIPVVHTADEGRGEQKIADS